jgi:N-methylhydantoinase B/oxoprolinase/acetone carboxylase alpha subunit
LPYCEFDVGKNDVLYMRMSSGGGYGDPLEREPERVLNDVENHIVSRDEAKEIYGIVLKDEDLVIDLAATERQRANLRQARLQEPK